MQLSFYKYKRAAACKRYNIVWKKTQKESNSFRIFLRSISFYALSHKTKLFFKSKSDIYETRLEVHLQYSYSVSSLLDKQRYSYKVTVVFNIQPLGWAQHSHSYSDAIQARWSQLQYFNLRNREIICRKFLLANFS